MTKKTQHPLEKAAADWIDFDFKFKAAMEFLQLKEFPSAIVGGATRYVVLVEEPFEPETPIIFVTAKTSSFWDYSFADKKLAISFMRCIAFAYAAKSAPRPRPILSLAT